MLRASFAVLALLVPATRPSPAADWPEWRGPNRLGAFSESNIPLALPSELPLSWSAPVRAGYSGPAVSQKRVFLTDYADSTERVLAFDESSGRLLWSHSDPVQYGPIQYNSGPRATPTTDHDRVYTLGATGELRCLRAASGQLLWRKHYPTDFHSQLPAWGFSSAPIVFQNLLITVPGGAPNAKIVALDKFTGREVWRALPSDSEPGYSQPILHQGKLIVWHAGAVSALDPASGKLLWEHPFPIKMSTPIATPVIDGPFLLVTAFFQGARLLRHATGELLWRGTSENELQSDTLHAALTTPIIDNGFLYGLCAYGELRCLNLATGKRIWQSTALLTERARNGSAFFVKNPSANTNRYLIHTDRGELVSATLSPNGYTELSRTPIITPTSQPGARRQLNAVNWVHPAFANSHILIRNDRELRRLSLRP